MSEAERQTSVESDSPAGEQPLADDDQVLDEQPAVEDAPAEASDSGEPAADEQDNADGSEEQAVEQAMPSGSAVGPTEAELEGMDEAALRNAIRSMQAQHAEQLDAEARARAEVEDMCLRIEKHFKAEKAARAQAEELMQQAIESEMATKSQLEMEQQRLADIDNDLELDRDKVRQERDALEGMRIDFEHELQAAQSEVAKAQDALRTAEERVRAAEQVEKQKIISDYEQRILAMSTDMMKMRDDMQQRTLYMTREMQRYQQAAVSTSNAMLSAKKEMQERRKDVDAMRVKLDAVMERLYSGHEHNLTLQANIGSAQDHAGQLFQDPYLTGMMASTGLVPADMQAMQTQKGATAGRGQGRSGRQGNNFPSVTSARQGAKGRGAGATTKGAGRGAVASTGRFRRAADMATW